jgi:hypothetical protein
MAKKKQLRADKRHKLSQTPTFVTLTIPKADVSDSGTFILKVENRHGKDSATIKVVVAGALCASCIHVPVISYWERQDGWVDCSIVGFHVFLW